MVEDVGFKELVAKLDATYTLPTRKAVKNLVEGQAWKAWQKAKAEIQGVETVSLTADMWTSINMDAYLAVICHYIKNNNQFATLLLGAKPFSKTHTNKIQCIVTD